MPNNQYGVYGKCENCALNSEYQIPQGITGEKFFKNKECDYCKCVGTVKIVPMN